MTGALAPEKLEVGNMVRVPDDKRAMEASPKEGQTH